MTTVNVGKSIEIDVDFTTMPQSAIDHILYIGARNILMDSHASITSDAIRQEFKDETMTDAELAQELREQATAMVQKKLDALMRGEVRVQSTREGDPVRAEAKAMAKAILTAKIKAAGKKVKDYEANAINEAIAKLITPELMTKAKARVDEAKGAAGDLSDLGL